MDTLNKAKHKKSSRECIRLNEAILFYSVFLW